MDELEISGLRSSVNELENQIEDLTQRLLSLEKTVEAMRALGENFWRAEAAVLLLGVTHTAWHFHACEDNLLFADIFACETNKDGTSKRWVGKSGEIGATIAINRAAPLVFSIHVVGFLVPELANTLSVEIDGATVPWTAHDGRLWSALVAERPGHARLHFRVSVDRNLVPPTKDVSFSIAEIRIARAAAGETVGQTHEAHLADSRAAVEKAPARGE